MTTTALDDALNEVQDARPDTNPAAPQRQAQPSAVGELTNCRLEDLFPDPDNPRDDVGDHNDPHLRQLAASMDSAGLLQPVIARREATTGRLLLVAGHRRLAAAQHLGWQTIPTVIRRDMRPDRVLAAMLIENGQRKDLDPIEEARALHRLVHEHKIESHADLARMVGRGQPYVSGRLALMDLSPSEQEEVRAGHMKLTEAITRGRLNSGKVKKKGQTKGWHLDHAHELAGQVKARCIRLAHSRGRTVGGTGCGECWEAVIRTDERAKLTRANVEHGTCPTCGTVGA